MAQLSSQQFETLAEIIYYHSGIRYDEKKKYLFENRLSGRLRELSLPDFAAYLSKLEGGRQLTSEVEFLVNAVTTNETCFFRNTRQLSVLQNIIVPEVLDEQKKVGRKNLRIWSAASSTGEEIYTIAMMLKHLNLIPYNGTASLHASDINREVLQAAEKAYYPRHSLRNMPEEYRKRYFSEQNGSFQLRKELIPPVSFERANLLELGLSPRLRDFDIIFCANVLIYFDVEAKKKVVAGLKKALAPNGYLLLGHAETLHGVTKDFKLVIADGIPVYRLND